MTGPSLPLVTQSQLRTFRRCQREHHLAYDMAIRPASSEAAPLRFGSAVHEGLAALWQGQGLDSALDLVRIDDPFEQAQASAMLCGYATHWGLFGGASNGVEVLAVEREFRAPLVNPATGYASQTFQLGGKVDAIARIDGRVLLVEHKTTSEDITPGSPYWQRLRIDTQIPLYLQGCRALGFEPVGVLYDVLLKPRLRPKKGEDAPAFFDRLCAEIGDNPGKYFAQREIAVLEDDVAAAMADAWQTARALREGQLAQRYPRNSDACVRWNRPCVYFDACTGQTSLDSSRFVRLTTPHPELSDAPPAPAP